MPAVDPAPVEAPFEAVLALFPLTSVELAVLHRSCIPPDIWRYNPNATNAINAATKQYSARPCPRSSWINEAQRARNMIYLHVSP